MLRTSGGATRTIILTATWIIALPLAWPVPPVARAENGGEAPRQRPDVAIKVKPGDVKRVQLRPDTNAELRYELTYGNGMTKSLTPAAYAAMLYESRSKHSLVFRILNIHSPFGFAWVTVGLVGQTLFAGRMIIQWLTSERHRRSLVPVQFWWMSLGGASMLLIYFIWRRDIVGILGQSVGWAIYIRNLYFIYRPVAHERR